ncbi:hypothetical protein RSO01_62990 [Reyranella soli]|uniref:Uncharacterized protein n=1 Tax=Reyranella soli TaxID=1230389 RepID=A0A512NJK8_9HYPH|nr:hypothetical protein RSO01_62990 [Reyranella soli]
MTSPWCGALCGTVLALATTAAAAQSVKAHMEACTRWGHAGAEYGTRNSCDSPVVIRFMALGDQHVVEREVAPGAWFGSSADLSGGWMFTACPVGYAPNLRFAVENRNAILDSLYNCLPSRPGA